MLKLISVNIEQDKHHETVVPFLKLENPDIVCLQEVFEKDLPLYEEVLGMKSYFKPMSLYDSSKDINHGPYTIGIAILTNLAMTHDSFCYSGDDSTTPVWERSADLATSAHRANYVVLFAEIEKEGKSYCIATTHLPVTPAGGISTPYQMEHAKTLLNYLSKFEDIIICGDLNAPRGLQTFALFEEKYKDNIPLEYDTSLDQKLHRKPGIILMVDGLFSTDHYTLTNVRLQDGVSDHKAIVATIEKVK